MYARGAVARGAVEVRSWCGRVTLVVRSRYARGAVEVRSWCGRGTLVVQSRYARGMVEVHAGLYTLHLWQLRMYTLQTKSLCQDVCHLYVTCRMHAVLQRYFLTYPLFGRCFELPSLSLCTVVHLTRAE